MKTAAQLVESHRRNGILLDTNILLLLFMGAYDKRRIPTFKRTKTFAIEDFDTLLNFVNSFDKVVTLPNILTEVSNLLSEVREREMSLCFRHFARGIDAFEERYLPSREIAGMDEFLRFGLTDAAILKLSSTKHLVLTDDFKLSGYLKSRGVDAINFNHIRVYNWH